MLQLIGLSADHPFGSHWFLCSYVCAKLHSVLCYILRTLEAGIEEEAGKMGSIISPFEILQGSWQVLEKKGQDWERVWPEARGVWIGLARRM